MLVVFFILLILYVGLTIAYLFTPHTHLPIDPWPLLPVPPTDPEQLTTACSADSDCPPEHLCLKNTCTRKLLRGGHCNPEHGTWTPFSYKNVLFAICSCYDNSLFTQKFFGGDCDVNVGCGVHGTYDPVSSSCLCDPGYTPDNLTCKKLPVLQYMRTLPCGPDELEVSKIDATEDGFHDDYVTHLKTVSKCVKRPCSFDALSGRPLKHAKFEKDWGCVCDPTYGLFGVVLDGKNKKYLNTEGFDACASIFVEDPPDPIDVEVVCYFYLGKREPISLIAYDLPQSLQSRLVPVLRGKRGKFMIGQSPWRYDYAQHFFKNTRTFRARTRIHQGGGTLHKYWRTNEEVYEEEFHPPLCRDVSSSLNPSGVQMTQGTAYRLLYEYPVCYIGDDAVDPLVLNVDDMFHKRFVLNPFQISYKDFENLLRFNAFVLYYDASIHARRWTLDLNYAYAIDLYFKMAASNTNVPVWDNQLLVPPKMGYLDDRLPRWDARKVRSSPLTHI